MFDKRIMALLQERRDDLTDWIETEAPYAPVDQAHLDGETSERAYWHLGYRAALEDVIEMTIGRGAARTQGRPN
jgi:hypothetical protein